MNARTMTTLATVGALALPGCTGSALQLPPAPAAETISWSVGPCFGFCPVYTVAVTPAGEVIFDGERHTTTLGRHVRQGGPQAYRAVQSALASYRPPSGTTAQTKCDQQASDLSSYRITWTTPDGRVTTLEHNKGCRSSDNDRLNAVLDALPAQAGVEELAKQLTRPGASRG